MTTNIHQSIKPATIRPGGNHRVLEHEPVNLWVISRTLTADKRQIEICRAIESVELPILELDGKNGRFVRYNRHYHRLHTPEEFTELLKGAMLYRYYFFNTGIGGHKDSLRLTSIAPFIYLDESEPIYL
jgi:hypothetical protein